MLRSTTAELGDGAVNEENKCTILPCFDIYQRYTVICPTVELFIDDIKISLVCDTMIISHSLSLLETRGQRSATVMLDKRSVWLFAINEVTNALTVDAASFSLHHMFFSFSCFK